VFPETVEMPLPLLLVLLSIAALASPASARTPMTDPETPAEDAPAHVRCAQLRPGMNYRDALALMGRPPDSTLSGHSAAGPDGHPPPGSFAIDFWNETDAHGRPLVSSVRYSGGVLESVDCGRPASDAPPSPTDPAGA